MNIFIAGATGAIGRPLLPMLLNAGHRVVAMTRSPDRARALAAAGAEPVIGDVYDPARLTDLVTAAAPDVVIHQLTAFGAQDADPLAETIRIRIEGTRNLIAAAQSAGAKRFIAQSISFIYTPTGPELRTEDTPLYLDAPQSMRPLAEAVTSLETQTLAAPGMDGLVLRYGWFYGPGTNFDPNDVIPRMIRKGRMAIVGEGAGVYSFIHVNDAAAATLNALTTGASGIYNIVDDDPAPLSEWLPLAVKLLNAPEPPRLSVDEARAKFGDMLVYIWNEQRGVNNAKAKRDLNWTPTIPTWRQGFQREFAPLQT